MVMQPKLKIRGQYIKDLSFENPNSPRIFLMISKAPPEINISVNVSSVALSVKPAEGEKGQQNTDLYEVTLQVDVNSVAEKISAFLCELKYCGVFSIEGEADEEEVKEALLVGAPGILFPFVREVIAKITSSAGFPPLMLEVIDFQEMYEQQLKGGSAKEKSSDKSA